MVVRAKEEQREAQTEREVMREDEDMLPVLPLPPL